VLCVPACAWVGTGPERDRCLGPGGQWGGEGGHLGPLATRGAGGRGSPSHKHPSVTGSNEREPPRVPSHQSQELRASVGAEHSAGRRLGSFTRPLAAFPSAGGWGRDRGGQKQEEREGGDKGGLTSAGKAEGKAVVWRPPLSDAQPSWGSGCLGETPQSRKQGLHGAGRGTRKKRDSTSRGER